MNSHITFDVSVPSDHGFYGRECNNPQCGRYFRIHEGSLKSAMHCPYCGLQFSKDELWTQDQLRYLNDRVRQKALDYAQKEVSRMLRQVTAGSKYLTYKPGPRSTPAAPRPPIEMEVDSELECPDCNTKFQVFGIFGHCPGCASENLLLYDANLAIIRREVLRSASSHRALRHAYGDLVSTFESFCRYEADRRGLGTARFQNIDSTRRLFRKELGVDILGKFSTRQKRHLKRVFAKRHVWEHNKGIINDTYVAEVPEEKHLLGQPASLSLQELEDAAMLLRLALQTLVDARP